ncbi:chromosome partition protein Smc [Moorella thermoacetica]|uniref:Chromosome partition protein Smc n=1 Tax=Neomoorella thermoacetica TaxID=1525 RepID=A0A1J5JW12_NEOTH|nr:chromosome segregation protein SMC [Moorella thermoacetica]OIQ09640.1 chromosome partition protein Smc [Moorella thermoacetica]
MFLKGIEIQGFKTFVDRVRLELGPGVTGIVGPNGSGKSNIVDAILWVLGEQSAKSLRGTRMDDVIFAGSARRRPVGMAEVTLYLDNSDASLPLDFQEVAITRRFFRSGEGEYYINKVPCRLKDIQELLLDTGSGRGGLAIVSQGRLEEILAARPEERRSVLEETAGIARYRLRKKEARQRLEAVEQDLTRLQDLIGELKDQLGPAAVEAARARRHQKLMALLNLVELILKSREMAESQNRLRRIRERWQALKSQEEELEAREEELAGRSRDIRERLARNQEARERSRVELQGLREQLVQVRGRLSLVDEKLAALARQRVEDREREGLLAREEEKLRAAAAELARQVETGREEMAALEQDLAAGRETREKLRAERDELAARLARLKEDLFQVAHERAGCHNELVRLEEKQAGMERVLEQKQRQLQELNNERERLEGLLRAGEEQLGEIEANLKALEGKKASLETELPLQEADLAAREKHLAGLKEQQRLLVARLKVLRQAQADYEGFGEGVRAILQARSRGEAACAGVLGVVVEKIEVPGELTRAIEVALGGAAQQVLVRTASEAERVIQFLKSRRHGRATILPLAWLEPRRWPNWAGWVLNEPGVVGVAAALVRSEAEIRPAVDYLLGQILVVADLRRALDLGERLRPPVRLVTLEGEVIQPRGPVTGGNTRQRAGFLQRRLEIQQGETELANLVARLNDARQQARKLASTLETGRQELRRVTEALIARRGELHNLLQRLSEYKDQLARLAEKTAVLGEELARSTTDSRELVTSRREREELLTRLEAREGELQGELTGCQEQLNACQQALAAVEQELAVNETRQQALAKAGEQLAARVEELARQKENWRRQQAELAARMTAAATATNELQENREKLAREEEWLAGAIQQAEEGLQRLDNDGSTCSQQQEELARELEELRARKGKIAAHRQQEELNLARLETTLEGSRAELEERFGPGWQEVLQKPRRHLEKEAPRLRRVLQEKLAALGEVNPGAPRVYEGLRRRFEELEQQRQDLEEGRAALEQVIAEMEKLMARQLRATLTAVQEHFAALFRELFEGGEASLELTGSDNILEAGLEIIARPPGKKPQHLALLSGGEKALTAVAFIFALLKVKPSAFCIFDEVDTALDEANVERFARLLRQFASRTQFIVISHRQGTMAAADVLYGVTMMEQGVSRLVSVRLEQLPA